MTDRELMQQALDALQNCANGEDDVLLTRETLAALRARLAQPEPEPVAQVNYNERQNIAWLFGKQLPDGTPLYTAPPQREWVGLMDEQIAALEKEYLFGGKEFAGDLGYWAVYRAIEAKLKEKNG